MKRIPFGGLKLCGGLSSLSNSVTAKGEDFFSVEMKLIPFGGLRRYNKKAVPSSPVSICKRK
jgi:hypothetical protein